jgi:uncharacterized lipoprotein
MRRSAALLLAVPLAIVLAGCSQVQDAVTGAAKDAASQAAQAAAAEVMNQVCAPLRDGVVSAADVQLFGALVSTAQAAGLDAQFLGPLEQIAGAGDQVPADAVTALLEACGPTATPTPTPSN